MKKKLLLLITLFLIIPSSVKAEEYFYCDSSNLSKLQKMATNITTAYDYVETFDNNGYGNINFTVKINNLDSRLYLVDKDTGKVYKNINGDLVLNNIKDNQSLKLQVYGNDYGCNGNFLLTIYVNIPAYNKYYKTSVCTPYMGYKLCNRWVEANMTYEEFAKVVETYKPKEEVIEKKEEQRKKTFEDYFIEVVRFLDKNRYVIFIPVIALSALGILFKLIFKKKEWEEIK